ncbi:site-2 protease family protein [[Eubacterium] hominis]|uniref:site-2 protease family protein n=1 Tax=[Eubacterium] hominis TaxID=2764325 RepID=UPI003A4E1733
MFQDLFSNLIYILPAVIIALSFHEFAHSFVAYKLGDVSQKESGRLSLNPLNHLDPIGTLSLIICGFGWAKPVQINPYFFKDRKSGMIQSAMAGPLANLIVGFIFMLLMGLTLKTGMAFSNQIGNYLYLLCYYTAVMNVGLAVFNLIPLPPLDGSKILMGILDEDTYFKIMQYEQYISIVLIILLIAGVLNGPLGYARGAILDFYSTIVSHILF